MRFQELAEKKKKAKLLTDVMANQSHDRLCVLSTRPPRNQTYVDGHLLEPSTKVSSFLQSSNYERYKYHYCLPHLVMMRDPHTHSHFPVLWLQVFRGWFLS